VAEPKIVFKDAWGSVGTSRNLVVCVWVDVPTTDHVRQGMRATLGIARKYGKDFGFLNVITGGKPSFDDGVREAYLKMIGDPQLQGHGFAHVIPAAGGLGTVAARTFVVASALFARATAPHKAFPKTRAAAEWLAPLLSRGREAWSAEEILHARMMVGKGPSSG
jgi:hypothetical protein